MTTTEVITTSTASSDLSRNERSVPLNAMPFFYAGPINDDRAPCPYEYWIGRNGEHGNMLGAAPVLLNLREQIDKVCKTKLNPSVIITGETGTGKELVAKALHYNGARKEFPFIDVNVGTLSAGIADSLLFGHMRGAFTGAYEAHEGLFEQVGRGTLFLDEIGELPLPLQVKLLRVLEEKRFERVGSVKQLKFHGTVVVATNKSLEDLVHDGRFRADLFHRLEHVPLFVPPLRERREDIGLLAQYFIQRYNNQNDGSYDSELEPNDIAFHYDFPGNVRELRNLVERAAVLGDGKTARLDPYRLYDQPRPLLTAKPYAVGWALRPKVLSQLRGSLGAADFAAAEVIVNAFYETRGNISKTANMAGYNRSTFRKKIKPWTEHGIDVGAIIADAKKF